MKSYLLFIAVFTFSILFSVNSEAGGRRFSSCGPGGCGPRMGSCGPGGCGPGAGSCGPGGCGPRVGGCGPGGCGPGGCGPGAGSCGPGGCGPRVGGNQNGQFGQDLSIDPNGNLSGFQSNIGAGVNGGGLADPALDSNLNTPTTQVAGHSSGVAAERTPQGWFEGGKALGISQGPGQIVQDPRTGQRISSPAGQIIVDTGRVARDQAGNRFTVYRPASLETVKKIVNTYQGDSDGKTNPLKQQVLNAYKDSIGDLAQNGSTGSSTLPDNGSGHSTPDSPAGTRPQNLNAPKPIAGSSYDKWQKRFSEKAAEIDKSKIQSQVSDFANEGKVTESTSVKVLNQDCASIAKPNDHKKTTVYVFSTTEKQQSAEGKEFQTQKTHVVIKQGTEEATKENMKAAWDLAKIQDVQKDGTTARDLGVATTPDMEKSALATWFVPGESVTKDFPNIGESQVQLRPIMDGEKVVDFATKYVFKDKQDSTAENHWEKSPRDFSFYCKTTGFKDPVNPEDLIKKGALKDEVEEQKPADDSKGGSPKPAASELKVAAANIVQARCVSCHNGTQKGRPDFSGERFADKATLALILDAAVSDNRMPPSEGSKLSEQEKKALSEFSQSIE